MPKPEDYQILNRQEEPSMTEPSLKVKKIEFDGSSATVEFIGKTPDGFYVYFTEAVRCSSDQRHDLVVKQVVKQADEQLSTHLAQISTALQRIKS